MKNLSRKLMAGILMATLSLGLVACGSSESKTETSIPNENEEETVVENTEDSEDTQEDAVDTSDLQTVRIGTPQIGDQYGLELGKLAWDEGILEEELNKVGYTAEVTGFAGAGPEINEAFASNALDIVIRHLMFPNNSGNFAK